MADRTRKYSVEALSPNHLSKVRNSSSRGPVASLCGTYNEVDRSARLFLIIDQQNFKTRSLCPPPPAGARLSIKSLNSPHY